MERVVVAAGDPAVDLELAGRGQVSPTVTA